MLKPRVLIADADSDFLSKIKNEGSQVDITLGNDLKAVQTAVSDLKTRYSAICINVNLCSPVALPLIRFVRVHRPSAPLHLISDTSPRPLSEEELKALHVQSMIEKPVTPQELMQTLIPGSYFNLAGAIAIGQAEGSKAGDTREAEDGQMHGIDAASFLCGQKSFFDLFVKLGSGKFLMILKAGDQFEPERLLNYLNRGVTSFYIKREAQLYYLQYCDKVTAAMLSSPQIPLENKVSQLQNLGKETFEFLKSAGVSESSLAVAGSFVQHANNLVRQNGLERESFVKLFMDSALSADHGTSTVMIVSMMIKILGFTDEKTVGLISMGAMLHDIGLLSLPEAIQLKHENESEFTPEEQALFETHPQLGADLLLKVPHMNPLLPQIALQHHERRNRKGFPSKLGSGSISATAEMVGLADLFLRFMRAPKDPAWTPLELIKRNHSDEFSLKVMDGFWKAFQTP